MGRAHTKRCNWKTARWNILNGFLLFVLVSGTIGLAYYAFGRGAGVSKVSNLGGRVNASDSRAFQKKIPLSGTCSFCHKKVVMPFRCSYCKKVFCEEHRLPEEHDCDGL